MVPFFGPVRSRLISLKAITHTWTPGLFLTENYFYTSLSLITLSQVIYSYVPYVILVTFQEKPDASRLF